VMANVHSHQLEGEAADLVARALALDPQNLKALVLAAGAASAQGNHAAAAALWARALPALPPGQPELGKYLQTRLDEANQKAGATAVAEALAPASAVAPTPAVTAMVAAPVPPAAAPLAGISGTVSLAPEVLPNVAPGDTVIVTVAALDKPEARCSPSASWCGSCRGASSSPMTWPRVWWPPSAWWCRPTWRAVARPCRKPATGWARPARWPWAARG
jgi:hypothetical protein